MLCLLNQIMRRKHLIFIVLVGCIIPLALFFSLTQKYLRSEGKPQRIVTAGKVTPVLGEESNIKSINQQLLSPVISNPMIRNHSLQNPVTVKSVVV